MNVEIEDILVWCGSSLMNEMTTRQVAEDCMRREAAIESFATSGCFLNEMQQSFDPATFDWRVN
jgi:hypothetical protein